ncbi:MAG: hypothetical protein JNN15_07395 [Blastocatellia bacterium]|nr:hypothetical protein [Blastocatellia bacterium]
MNSLNIWWEGFVEWLKREENGLFLFLLALHFLPLWSLPYFSTCDGPAHIYNAQIMLDYFKSENLTVFEKFYSFNNNIGANWLGHILLSLLLAIFPPFIAEKVLISGYLLLLPLSVRYACKAINPESKVAVLLIFPIVYNSTIYFGFYYFCYSIGLFFLVFGYWIKYQNSLSLSSRHVTLLLILVLLLYLSHPFSFTMAALLIGFHFSFNLIADLVKEIRTGRRWENLLTERLKSQFLPLTIAFLPTTLLMLSWAITSPTTNDRRPQNWQIQKLYIWIIESISIYYPNSLPAKTSSAAFLILLALLTIYCIFSRNSVTDKSEKNHLFWIPILLFIPIVGLVLPALLPAYLLTLDNLSAIYLFTSERCCLYVLLTAILWIAVGKFHKKVLLATKIAITSISLVLLVMQILTHYRLQSYVEEILSYKAVVAEKATVLPLFLHYGALPKGGYDILPPPVLLHTPAYVATEKELVNLGNYEAHTGAFPINFQQTVNPFIYIGGAINSLSAAIDILSYRDKTGIDVDYVVVYTVPGHKFNEASIISLYAQLEVGYELIYTSPERGFIEVYRKKRK